jgi:GNAT superfamily N-acetyltransferase
MRTTTGVHIRPFEATDYAAVAALNNANFPEFAYTAEEVEDEDRRRQPPCLAARWVAELDGRAVGFAEYSQYQRSYHPRRFNLELVVDPACHGQGIGRQLFGTLVDALRGFDPLSVELWSREDMVCRVAFLEHRGFVPDHRIWSSELDLGAFDPSRFEAAVRAVEAQGISIRSLAELRQCDSDHERKLYELWEDVHEDVPRPPEQPYQRVTFERWRTGNLGRPNLLPEAYLVAVDGEQYVATTQLWRSPEPARLRTGLTGVRRAYRRRGLALGLKVRALGDAKAAGFGSVCTENASTNVGMLAVNDQLGFVRRPAWVHYTAPWAALPAAA